MNNLRTRTYTSFILAQFWRIPLASPPADWRRQPEVPHHVAQQGPTGFETPPRYAPRSGRFGSEPPSVEDYVEI